MNRPHEQISTEELMAAADLFWPDFVLSDGLVLRAQVMEGTSVKDWSREPGSTKKGLEITLNHVHLYDVISDVDITPEGLRDLERIASAVKECWRAALIAAFPERTFVVDMESEPAEYGPTITFWERENSDG